MPSHVEPLQRGRTPLGRFATYIAVRSGFVKRMKRAVAGVRDEIETIASLKDLRRVVDSPEQSTQIDVAPDGSPIFARDIGTHEIYALNVAGHDDP